MDPSLPKSNRQQTGGQPGKTASSDSVQTTRQQSAGLTDDIIQSQQDLAHAATGGTVPIDDTDEKTQTESAQPVSGPKEQREWGPASAESEKLPIVERKEPEPSPEVKDWMQKLEEGESVQLPQPVTDDYGKVLVQAAGSKKPKIVLPLDEDELNQGLHKKVTNSVRWLAEWCVRVMKKAAGRVFYKPTQKPQ